MLGNEVQLFVEYNKVRYHVNPYFTMKFDEYINDGKIVCSKRKNGFVVQKQERIVLYCVKMWNMVKKYSKKIIK